jgi:hypothetical protein
VSTFLENPYATQNGQSYQWLRGNLHAHSNRSDGNRNPQEVIDSFANKGYQIFALSDHDVFSDYTGLNSRGMIFVTANEVSANGPHILQIGSSKRADTHGDRQKVIDEILATGGFAIVNHPNWGETYDHISFEKMQKLQNYVGMEIYNAGCYDHAGSSYAIEKWDRLLSVGRIVWGFANDDTHEAKEDGLGWNMVLVPAKDQSPQAVYEAFKNGRFYASSGVTFSKIEVNGSRLKVRSENADALEVIGNLGRQVAFVEGNEIEVDASGLPFTYLRVQAYGKAGRFAWTQPFVIRGAGSDLLRKLEIEADNEDIAKPSILVPTIKESVPSDAKWDHPVWKRAPESHLKHELKTGMSPVADTSFKVLKTPTHLVFNIYAEEPTPEKMVLDSHRLTSGADSNLWRLECVQLFLDTERMQKNYYHFVIAADGRSNLTHPLGWDKSLKYQISHYKTAEGWEIQLSIALDSLNPKGVTAKGESCGFHVARNRACSNEHYVWTWVGGTNHRPTRFGKLIFE